jgi:uncharacterized membrane protein YcaP (DUF421 family)
VEALGFDAPLWQTVLRGTAMYLVVAALIRIIPKRHAGNLSPYDLIALIIIGDLAGSGIIGDAKAPADILLLVLVVLAWDHALNLLEYYFPRFRRVAQDSPTLLVHNGKILGANLRKEKLTEEELRANLRKRGFLELDRIRLAVLEVDGQVSVVEKD